jgi:transposase
MLIRRCAQLEVTTPADVTSAAVYTLRLLARRILELTTEIHDLVHHISDTITRHCPRLLTRRGVGPDNAAALLITAGDNPTDSTAKPPSPPCAGSTPWKPPPAKPAVAG